MTENNYSFKKLFLVYTLTGIPFTLPISLSFIFNILPFNYEGQTYSGSMGFAFSLCYILIGGLVLSILNWTILNLGDLIYKMFWHDERSYKFKRLFLTYLFIIAPLSVLEGVLALFHLVPVNFNNTPTYGLKGFIIVIIFSPFILSMISGANWIGLQIGDALLKECLKIFKRKSPKVSA
ncbi:hypothetical protein FFF34_010915 [Inquilinus sp. KBS0705]|nr:hypothetical protein FFF34_010915 [Inquilinus sp. KBS0705]